MYQVKTLHTLNLHHGICQLYPNLKKEKVGKYIRTHSLDTELKDKDNYHQHGQKIPLQCLKPKLKCGMT